MPKPKLIETPEKLYTLFCQFKEYRKSNPKYDNGYDFSTKKVYQIPREVPLTWSGFEIWLRTIEKVISDLGDYESNKDGRYTEYATIIATIKAEIEDDMLCGAAAGVFKENIMSRKLALSDKRDHEVRTPEPIQIVVEKSDP